jgi:hypothetical protein
MSMRPSSRVAAATVMPTDVSSRTSQAKAADRLALLATRSQAGPEGLDKSTPATAAPSAAKRSQHAAPIPEAAPVTSATLPSIRPMTSPSPFMPPFEKPPTVRAREFRPLGLRRQLPYAHACT